MPVRRVLFAIRDPARVRQPGLARAIQVARSLGASLEMFHAIPNTLIIMPGKFDPDAADRLRERIEGQARVSLARLCAIALRHGVTATPAVSWDHPPHEAILRRAAANGAGLIIVECHQGDRSRRWRLRPTDWELLRASPLPVLLLKGGRPYHRPLLLAAVDPSHAHAKPAALDSRILDAAAEFGAGLRGEVHLAHANSPSIVGLDPKVAAKRAASSWSTLTFGELQDQERQAFEKFRAKTGIRRTRAHVVDGSPAVVIPRLAQDLGAGIVVMGAVSRSALARAFIGNTAERVLDALTCDVLVVKPESAASGARQQDRELRAAGGAG